MAAGFEDGVTFKGKETVAVFSAWFGGKTVNGTQGVDDLGGSTHERDVLVVR